MNSINFSLEPDSKIRLYHQLYEKISGLIKDGTYKPHSKLPSIRLLSTKLVISKNTVTKAYEQLEKNKFIYSEQKRGYFVSDLSKSVPATETVSILEDDDSIPTVDAIIKNHKKNQEEVDSITSDVSDQNNIETQSLIPTNIVPDTAKASYTPETENPSSQIETCAVTTHAASIKKKEPAKLESVTPTDSLSFAKIETIEQKILNCYQTVLFNARNQRTNSSIVYKNFRKSVSKFISSYLTINCDEQQIVFSASTDLLLSLITNLQSLNSPYIKSNGVGLLKLANQISSGEVTAVKAIASVPEDIDPNLRKIILSGGLAIQTTSTDIFGPIPDFLSQQNATTAFVIPKSVPISSVKNQEERNKNLLSWANQHPCRYIIEYDTQNLANKTVPARSKCRDFNDRVIYINSFENLLPFQLKTAFAILPKDILADYQQRYDSYSCPVSLLEQQVLTDFIDKGYLDDYLFSLRD